MLDEKKIAPEEIGATNEVISAEAHEENDPIDVEVEE